MFRNPFSEYRAAVVLCQNFVQTYRTQKKI